VLLGSAWFATPAMAATQSAPINASVSKPLVVTKLQDLDLGTVVRYPEPQTLGTAVGNRTFSKEWPEKLKSDPVSGTARPFHR